MSIDTIRALGWGLRTVAAHSRAGYRNGRRRRLDAVLVFEHFGEFIGLFDREVDELFCEFFDVCHGV